MDVDILDHDAVDLLRVSATHPIEPPWGALGALLLLAGSKPAASSRLPSPPHDGPLGRVQLRFLG